jgi:aryl-alcohol dehydrogenase-like predicted oxidoreductase
MEYRSLGNTGMKLSVLGFGASSLGGVFHALKEEEGINAVHTAIDNGINFIDVSPMNSDFPLSKV